MAALALVQAFETAINRHPSNAGLARSYERFDKWQPDYEASSANALRPSLQSRLSELPSVKQELLSVFSTLSFLLEQVYYNGPEPDAGTVSDHHVDTTEVDGQIALIQISMDKISQISTLADEIDTENDYAQALQSDMTPTESGYDIAYVVDKFPTSKAGDWLLSRLGIAISHRRCYLRFRRFQVQYRQHARAALALFPDQPDEADPFGHANIDAKIEEDTAEIIPRLEDVKSDDGLVECPCCQKRLNFTTEHAWRCHFLADLRPYVCMSSDCSMRLFSIKNAWLDHEMEHLRDWNCPLCRDDHAFGSFASYLEHVDDNHQHVQDEALFQSLIDLKSTPREHVDIAECPLCDWFERDVSYRCLLEHLAVHLERLAIYAFETKGGVLQPQLATAYNQMQSAMPELPRWMIAFLGAATYGTITYVLTSRSRSYDSTFRQIDVASDLQKKLVEDLRPQYSPKVRESSLSKNREEQSTADEERWPIPTISKASMSAGPNPPLVSLRSPMPTDFTEGTISSNFVGDFHKASVNSDEKKRATAGKKAFACQWCSWSFSKAPDLRRHQRFKHPDETGATVYTCPHDGCRFASPRCDKIVNHCYRIHGTNTRPSDIISTISPSPSTGVLQGKEDSGGISFFFQLQGMVPEADLDDHDRLDCRGRWLPPKREGSNRLYTMEGQRVPVTLTFCYNEEGTKLLNVAQISTMRSREMAYKTYSVYCARGVFWTVDYDATKRRVGDGKHYEDKETSASDNEDDDDDDDDDDEPYFDDWTEISFGRVEGHQSLSYVGRHLSEKRLLAQRRDQDWVQHLVPDRYQSHITSRDSRSGGLVGDLPLLIALVAMSMPISKWATLIPQTIVNPRESHRAWRICQEHLDQVDRGSQWHEQRGVVVKIFRHPQGSSADELHDFEHGVHGPIFD